MLEGCLFDSDPFRFLLALVGMFSFLYMAMFFLMFWMDWYPLSSSEPSLSAVYMDGNSLYNILSESLMNVMDSTGIGRKFCNKETNNPLTEEKSLLS